jgi:predicted nucleic acid-binding protein
MIHLDTGFLIRALVRNSSEDIKFRTWLRSNVRVGISSVAWAEFLCGPVGEKEVDLATRILVAHGSEVGLQVEKILLSASALIEIKAHSYVFV